MKMLLKKQFYERIFRFYAYFNVLKKRIPVKAPITMFLRAVSSEHAYSEL